MDTSNHCFRIVINIFTSDVNYRSHLSRRVDARLIFYEGMKRQKVSLYLDANLHEHIILLQKIKWKWKYCSVSNVGIQNSKNMAVSTAGSWCCSPCAVRHGRQNRRTLLLYMYL